MLFSLCLGFCFVLCFIIILFCVRPDLLFGFDCVCFVLRSSLGVVFVVVLRAFVVLLEFLALDVGLGCVIFVLRLSVGGGFPYWHWFSCFPHGSGKPA